MLSINDWPRGERPRERLLARGAATLTDAELLALVLGASSRGSGGVVETARALLARLGGLDALTRSRPGELMATCGIGAARACALLAVVELARRFDGSAALRGTPITAAGDVYRCVRARLAILDHELFLTLSLDAKHRVLAISQVAQGGATSVEVHPREVFMPGVREAAAAVIVAHNHPSGDPEPSGEDRRLTSRLRKASELLGIPLIDHVIVGAGGYISLAERGLL